MTMNSFTFSKDPLVRYMQRRMHLENQNINLVFAGGNGSGKSWASIYLAKRIDPNFTPDRIAFSAIEFFKILKSSPPRGSVIVIEEAGVQADSSRFQEMINKAISYVQQTIRCRNYCFIYNVPSKSWITKRVRPLLHIYVEMKGRVPGTDTSIGKINWIQPNFQRDKIYYHTPTVCIKNIPYYISKVFFPKPPQSLIDPYEEKKASFVDNIIDEGLMIAQLAEQKQQLKKDMLEAYLKAANSKGKSKAEVFAEETGLKKRMYYTYKKKFNSGEPLPEHMPDKSHSRLAKPI